MPPRNQQSATQAGGSGKKGGKEAIHANEQPDEDPLVAVILADSYDEHFTPLTLGTPRCLLPLANVPLIDYSIESATVTGVNHIYILACAHSNQIRQHVSGRLQATLRNQGIGITVMSTPEARSEGDALRELDAKQVLRSDFLLYRADSVCTFDLKRAVAEHKRRRKVDKDVIMTMCCMPVQEQTEMRSKAVRPVHYVDPASSQVLHYELQHHFPKQKSNLPYELLRLDDKNGVDEIDVRYDLVEAGVDVCSIDVPPLFSENFDYQSLSLDFIPGILTSDLLESKFFLQVYQNGYGGRARDTATYDAISKSILRRWTFPITPAGSGWLGEEYMERKGWKYIGDGLKSDRSSVIGTGTMIGSDCTLAPHSTVSSSILGKGVKVQTSARVVNSHVHANSTIGTNAQVDSCIVGQGVTILDNVQLGKGCLIGSGCVVGPNVTLPAGSRVGLKKRELWDASDDDEEEEGTEAEAEAEAGETDRDAQLGSHSKGYLWTNLWLNSRGKGQNDDEYEDEVGIEGVANLRLRAIGYQGGLGDDEEAVSEAESVSTIEGDSDLSDFEEGEDDGEEDGDDQSSLSASNIAGLKNMDLTLDEEGDTKMEQEATNARLAEFRSEATASLQRALDEGHTVDNASIELKTLRMASNVGLNEVRSVTINVLLAKCDANDAKQVQQLMTRWAQLISLVSSDDEPESINMIQSYCADHASQSALFVPLLKMFYNDDVFQEESFVAWWRSKDSQMGSDKRRELRQRAQGVIRYILESDDDEEEESDE